MSVKRAPGRPKKAPGEKLIPIRVCLHPKMLALIDDARLDGESVSEVIAGMLEALRAQVQDSKKNEIPWPVRRAFDPKSSISGP